MRQTNQISLGGIKICLLLVLWVWRTSSRVYCRKPSSCLSLSFCPWSEFWSLGYFRQENTSCSCDQSFSFIMELSLSHSSLSEAKQSILLLVWVRDNNTREKSAGFTFVLLHALELGGALKVLSPRGRKAWNAIRVAVVTVLHGKRDFPFSWTSVALHFIAGLPLEPATQSQSWWILKVVVLCFDRPQPSLFQV